MGEKTFGFVSSKADNTFSLELLAGPGASPRPSYKDLLDSHQLAGWHHVCLWVDDVDLSVMALRGRGVAIITEPQDVPELNVRFAFFTDPWGNLFELIQAIGNQSK